MTSPFPQAVDQSSVAPTPPKSPLKNVGIIVSVLVGGMILGYVFLVFLAGNARQAALRMDTKNKLIQIAIGIHNYHGTYNQLPYSFAVNTAGEETIGWRLAISPYVEGQSQWAAIDPQLAWNSPENLPVSTAPPLAFQSHSRVPGETTVFAIISDGGVFPSTPMTAVRFPDILDGTASTVMIIDLPNRTTVWSSTENLTVDEVYQAITELKPKEVAHMLMADGSVSVATSAMTRDVFESLVTKSGGEPMPNF